MLFCPSRPHHCGICIEGNLTLDRKAFGYIRISVKQARVIHFCCALTYRCSPNSRNSFSMFRQCCHNQLGNGPTGRVQIKRNQLVDSGSGVNRRFSRVIPSFSAKNQRRGPLHVWHSAYEAGCMVVSRSVGSGRRGNAVCSDLFCACSSSIGAAELREVATAASAGTGTPSSRCLTIFRYSLARAFATRGLVPSASRYKAVAADPAMDKESTSTNRSRDDMSGVGFRRSLAHSATMPRLMAASMLITDVA
jgi:hypothetical protein